VLTTFIDALMGAEADALCGAPYGQVSTERTKAVLAEQHDDWIEGRRYLGLDILAKARLTAITDATSAIEEVTPDTDLKGAQRLPTNGSCDTTATHADGLDQGFPP
jgi:hypothetical protein